jgi:histidinol-phosphate aminotransferase
MSTAFVQTLARRGVLPLPPYNAGLSSDAVRARYGVADIVRLASNENPHGASPAVASALHHIVAHAGIYPDAASTSLRDAIASRTATTSAHVVVGNGSEDILQMLCLAFLEPGDRVVTQRPTFGLHEIYPRMMGATVETVALTASFEFDVEAWCAALARGPKMAMLANPSNPVGCMFDAENFARLLAAAPPGMLWVIDEAYYEYARHAPGFPDALAMLRKHAQPWIVLRTFSKAWGLAGLRVGYGLASSPELVQLLDRVRTPFNVNCVAQQAALVAWGDPDFMERAVADTIAQRDALASRIRAMALPRVRIAPSVANFLFIDLARPNGPVTEALLARGIIVKPWKETGFETFIRVSVGTVQSNERFAEALESIYRSGA